MKNFKVEVSKGLEKYNLIRKSESERQLREELHKEGFSILTVQEIGEVEISGNKFYFEILEKDGNKKIGTIVSNDIFKAYLKIKYELNYNLVSLYQNPETSLEEKQKMMKELDIHYKIYLNANKKDIEKKQEEESKKTREVKEETTDVFIMKKELDQVYKIIDKVLLKLKSILEGQENEFINFEKKELLKKIFNELIKLKTSTNIPKLRQIGEVALTKIGEIELQILETKKEEEYEILLKETNKLLREVGSKKSFIQKEKDLNYIFNNIVKEVILYIKSNKKEKKKKIEIDTTSIGYLRNKHLLNKYEARLKNLQKEKFQNFLIYIIPTKQNTELKIEFELKEKVIRQNITLLKGRISGNIFSYVKIVKGYQYFIEKFLVVLNFFKIPFHIIILFYGFIFLIIHTINGIGFANIPINFHGMFYFLYINIILILLQMTKGMITLSINIVILSFLFIFGVVNF